MSIAPGALPHLSQAVQQQRVSNINDLPAAVPAAASAASIAASADALLRHQQTAAAALRSIAARAPALITTDVEELLIMDGCSRRRPPVVPAYCPARVTLQPGRTYRWCACGRSKKQPWCDDSHTASDPRPVVFSVTEQQSVHWLCLCKYSSTPPFCDGSHNHAVPGYEEDDNKSETGAGRTTLETTTTPVSASASLGAAAAASDL